MFPVSLQVTVAMLLVAVVAIFLAAVFTSLMLNWALKTPPPKYLLSSGIIATAVFMISLVLIIYLPGDLNWYNSIPQNFRTHIRDYGLHISVVTAFFTLIAWQTFNRWKDRNS